MRLELVRHSVRPLSPVEHRSALLIAEPMWRIRAKISCRFDRLNDGCGETSVFLHAQPLWLLDTGQSIIVTITVTDINGTSTSCEVEVVIDDTIAPEFVNCPTEPVMIGNDPDECSGKLNHPIPVATDNCELDGLFQISGPPSGTVVPVCEPQTVVFEAMDAAGNTSTCTFEVLVVDTQDPEFDADKRRESSD